MNEAPKQARRPVSRAAAPARAIAAVAVAAALSAGAPAGAGAQEAKSASGTENAERGEVLYRIHCTSCHGREGAGDGPVASELRTPPTDLRLLAQRAGGEFPAEKVRAGIDGRTEVAGHGTREMPVWGLSFAQRGRDVSQEREIQAELDALVRYVKSIQRR